MNKVFTAIALQSAIAAAVIVAAPLASAEEWTEPAAAPFTSSVSREAVRQEAIEASKDRAHSGVSGENALEPVLQPFTSTVSRAQVRAEAVEATRLGLFNRYEDQPVVSAAQLERIRLAGQRTNPQDLVAATR